MSSSETLHRLRRSGASLALCLMLTGCFQPVYGILPHTSSSDVKSRLSQIDVLPIEGRIGLDEEARIGIHLRNKLIFALNGTSATSSSPTQRLSISLKSTSLTPLTDRESGRPEAETYALNAKYTLTESATDKVILTGEAFGRVSADFPGQQRFTRLRGLRDAQNRAAETIAEQIRNRLVSHFSSPPP